MRIKVLILMAMTIVALWSGCRQAEASTSEEVLEIQISMEPRTLHPILGSKVTSSSGILVFITETLTGYDPENGEPVGLIAELPKVSEDFKECTYVIYKEAAWPDGTLITGADVQFSAKVVCSPFSSTAAFTQVMNSNIESIIVAEDNPRKVVLRLKEASVQNPFFMNDIPILDKRFFDPEGILDKYSLDSILADVPALYKDSALVKWGEAFLSGDYGLKPENLRGTSGPYQVVEWIQRDRITISRTPNYWGKNRNGILHQQIPKQIVFRVISDGNAIELQVKQGVLDVASSIRFENWKDLSESEHVVQEYEMLAAPKTSSLYIGFNCSPEGSSKQSVFKDWRVRRAVSHLVSGEAFNQEYFGGRAIPINTPVPVISRDYNKSLQARVRSRDSAIYWLSQAGWEDRDGDLMREKEINGRSVPLQAVFSIPQGAITESFAEQLIVDAAAVGFKIEPDLMSMGEVAKQLQAGGRGFDMLMIGMQYGLAPYEFNQQWTTEALREGSNFLGYTNPLIDSLSALSESTPDLEKRRPLMMQMQEIWYHDQPAIMIVNLVTLSAVRKAYGVKEPSKIHPYLWVNSYANKEN